MANVNNAILFGVLNRIGVRYLIDVNLSTMSMSTFCVKIDGMNQLSYHVRLDTGAVGEMHVQFRFQDRLFRR